MALDVTSPMKPIANPPETGKSTGGGTFGGEDGYPKQTQSPNLAPQKTREPLQGSKDLDVVTPIQKIEQ